MTNLKEMSLKKLTALQRRVTSEIAARKGQATKARAKVIALAKSLGVSVRDLVRVAAARGPDKKPRRSPGPARRANKIGKARGRPPHVKHINGGQQPHA